MVFVCPSPSPSLHFDSVLHDGLLNCILQQPTGIQNILIPFITLIPRVLANQVHFSPRHFQHIRTSLHNNGADDLTM